jgi:hypothetical protein
MSLLGPKHTPESVARVLADGLERGTITLGRTDREDVGEWEVVVGPAGQEVAVKVSVVSSTGLPIKGDRFRDILVAALRKAVEEVSVPT